jgi:hypothetical protein
MRAPMAGGSRERPAPDRGATGGWQGEGQARIELYEEARRARRGVLYF